VRESIRLENVSFAYGDEKEHLVLKGVDLEIPSRSQTAIVGRSGGGKSTLVDLIPRLREATSGEILFDGRRIQDFELHSLRRSIGFMTQDALLFDDTIRVNLVYGLDQTNPSEEIDKALSRPATARPSSATCPAVSTRNVGDRGVRLSGGQRQRLALARVFLQDPDILILDEPTSALDSESEEYIQKALESRAPPQDPDRDRSPAVDRAAFRPDRRARPRRHRGARHPRGAARPPRAPTTGCSTCRSTARRLIRLAESV
jgi:ABC-type multidrug transport system fused ATPase/permease subunit